MDLSKIRTLPAKTSGIWFELDDARFLIAYGKGPAYQRALKSRVQKVSQNRLKQEDGLAERINREAMAEAVLLDFEGITENGVPLANTFENRVKILEIAELAEFIAASAQDVTNFRAEGEAKDVDALKSTPSVDA